MSARYAVTPIVTFALAGLAAPAWFSVARADIQVEVNFAQLYKLPDDVSTIVIGNPAIADVTIQQSGNRRRDRQGLWDDQHDVSIPTGR